MIDLRAVTEAEMVLAFLGAEVDSTRFGDRLEWCAQRLGITLAIVRQPDPDSPQQDAQRRALLGCARGYPGTMLFTGFPADVTWHLVKLEADDIERLRYARVADTLAIAGDCLLVTVGAESVRRNSADAQRYWGHVGGIRDRLRAGHEFPPLIAAQMSDGSLNLIEGHSRATAYMIEGTAVGREVIVGRLVSLETGTSARTLHWRCNTATCEFDKSASRRDLRGEPKIPFP